MVVFATTNTTCFTTTVKTIPLGFAASLVEELYLGKSKLYDRTLI